MNPIADKPVRLGDFVECLDSSDLQVGDWDVRTSFCNFVDKNYGACCDDTVPMQLIYEWWKAYLEDLIRMSYADQFHVNEYGCDAGDPIYTAWTASAGQNTLTAEKLFTAVPVTVGGQFDIWNQAGHVCANSVEPENVYAVMVKLLDRTFYNGEFLKPYGESKKVVKESNRYPNDYSSTTYKGFELGLKEAEKYFAGNGFTFKQVSKSDPEENGDDVAIFVTYDISSPDKSPSELYDWFDKQDYDQTFDAKTYNGMFEIQPVDEEDDKVIVEVMVMVPAGLKESKLSEDGEDTRPRTSKGTLIGMLTKEVESLAASCNYDEAEFRKQYMLLCFGKHKQYYPAMYKVLSNDDDEGFDIMTSILKKHGIKSFSESAGLKESKLSEDVNGCFYVIHESPIGYKGHQGWIDDYSELTSDIGSAEHYDTLEAAVDMLYAIEDYVENFNDGEGIRATIQCVNPDAGQVLEDMAVVDIQNNGVVNSKPVSGEQNLAKCGYLTEVQLN